jgi:nanoRNase/pAp phosphatase (c-di-AMP/oligoRNAs hydrolase)
MGQGSEGQGNQVAGEDARRDTATLPERFFDLLAAHQGEKHVIVLQDFPDPDAISSAFAHNQISAASDIESVIMYADHVSHPQNVAMVRLLEIDLQRFEPGMSLEGFDAAVFVDNQGTTSEDIMEALSAIDVPTLIVVDHHSQQGRLAPEFSDIRDVGAVATIYAQYLEHEACPIQLDKTERRHVMLATALMHGIVTDTNSFMPSRRTSRPRHS